MTDDVDVLGPGWTARTLTLRPDGRSPDPVATLVHRLGPPSPGAVLYVHGFVDYFFHTAFGDALAAHGYDVYALDLRDYGRSIRPGRPPNHVTDLGRFAEEIDAAIRIIRAEHDEVVLLAHSMGGLVTSLWADSRRGEGLIDALVLNSPWLDLRGTWFERTVLTGVLDVVGAVAPDLAVSRIGPHYGRALHESTGGEWSYDLAWKPFDGFPARAGFGRAVRRGHARVARGLAIDVPVLVLASDASGPDDVWHDALLTTDSVLDVGHIRDRAPLLGPDVTFVEVPGGAHDLALSPAPARDTYVAEVLAFLDARLP
jgi:alpha-beta hydrolase superfamily lysophospholipase